MSSIFCGGLRGPHRGEPQRASSVCHGVLFEMVVVSQILALLLCFKCILYYIYSYVCTKYLLILKKSDNKSV